MFPRSILITGTNRGLGLELVRQIVRQDPGPDIVIAACRNPDLAEELKVLSKSHTKVRVIKLDAGNDESIQNAYTETCKILGDKGLNVLINNAGINLKQQSISTVTSEKLLESLKINVVGPAIVTKTFLPLLRKAASGQDGRMSWSRAAIVNISSLLGSIGLNLGRPGTYYQYRESKAALNQLTKNLCIELSPEGILATCIHPGWVRTDMGGPNGNIGTEESVEGMLRVFKGMNDQSAGKLLSFDGSVLEW